MTKFWSGITRLPLEYGSRCNGGETAARERYTMKWITRKRIQVNRTATCCSLPVLLIPRPTFFSPQRRRWLRCKRKWVQLDSMLQTQHTHTKMQRVLCSFAALMCEQLAHDQVLVEMARIVQAADFNDQLDDHPIARGLQLISRGFPLVTSNDHETVERAAFVVVGELGTTVLVAPPGESTLRYASTP
jgi:hypothetical protein